MLIPELAERLTRYANDMLFPAYFFHPGTGEAEVSGRFVSVEGSEMRLDSRGDINHMVVEMWVSHVFLPKAGAKDGVGYRNHAGVHPLSSAAPYQILVPDDIRVEVRRIGSYVYFAACKRRTDAPAAENEAANQNQSGYFKLAPGSENRYVLRREYGDYRMNREPTKATQNTDVHGVPLD